MSLNLDQIRESLHNLSNTELEQLSTQIYDILVSAEPSFEPQDEPIETITCPKCGNHKIVRHGKFDGKQRYMCKECRGTFSLTTGKANAYSKLSRQQWQTYIKCLINGYSIRLSAEITETTVRTSFFMRHKILNALETNAKVTGLIEMDETFLRESFKGNHTNGQFELPRASRKRGKQASKRGISSEQICIATAIDRQGNTIMRVLGKGRATSAGLLEAYKDCVGAGATVCTDSLAAYKTVAGTFDLDHKQIPSGRYTNGSHNLARINAFHSRFKTWIRQFCGVSTKHLMNYLAWFNWIEQNKDVRYDRKPNKMMQCVMLHRV